MFFSDKKQLTGLTRDVFFPARILSVCALCTQGPLLQPTSASLVLLGLAKASVNKNQFGSPKLIFLEEGRGVWGVVVLLRRRLCTCRTPACWPAGDGFTCSSCPGKSKRS